jgi:hypothetical protein
MWFSLGVSPIMKVTFTIGRPLGGRSLTPTGQLVLALANELPWRSRQSQVSGDASVQLSNQNIALGTVSPPSPNAHAHASDPCGACTAAMHPSK